ncbi:hypothetical protein C0J52_06729, partial [Blattella germanica]
TESGYCAQEKIDLPEYHRLRAAVTWKYLGVYINHVHETFLFPFFGDLELSIILIGMVKNVSVLELSTCQIFKILVLVSKILYQ